MNTLTFELKLNGYGKSEKDMEALEKKLSKIKDAVNDINDANKKLASTTESAARKQVEIAAKERQLKQEEKAALQKESQLKKQIADDERKAARDKSVQNKKTQAENKEAANALKQQRKQALDQIEIERGSIKGMRLEVSRLKEEYISLSKLEKNTSFGRGLQRNLANKNEALTAEERAIGVHGRNVGNYPLAQAGQQLASNFSGGLIGNGAVGGMVAAGLAVVQLTKELVDLNVKIDKQQGAIAKTTGLTNKEVEGLTDTLRDLDTTTKTIDLLKISEEVGRFGVNTKAGVEKATIALNLLAQGLGDEFGGGVEQITTTVAQLSNVVYGATTDGELMAERYLHLGNVLNGLANAGSATAGQIADVATRIGGTAKAFGYTESQILGISSAIVEAGINVERGSGAFTRAQSQIRSNTDAISKFLGVTRENFEELLNTKPAEAFEMLVSKVSQVSKNKGTDVIKILNDLKIKGEGTRELFLKWGQQQDLFNTRMDQSAGLIGNVNTLLKDQQTLTDTVSGQWARLTNALSDAFVKSSIQDGLKGFTKALADLVDGLTNAKFQQAVDGFNELMAYASGVKVVESIFDIFKTDKEIIHLKDFGYTDWGRYLKMAEDKSKELLTEYSPFKGSAILNPGVKVKTDAEIYEDEKTRKAQEKAAADRKRKMEEEAREAERIAARGVEGSIARYNVEIGELTTLMERASDTRLLKEYQVQLNKLNQGLANARLQQSLLNDPSLQKIASKSFGVVDSLIGNIDQLVGKQTNFDPFLKDKAGEDKDKGEKDAIKKYADFVQKLNEEAAEKNKEADDERTKTVKENNDKARAIYEESAYATTNALFGIWDAYYQRRSDKELERLDKEYEKKIEAVKGNTTLELALQRELEEKKEATLREYGKKRQRLAIIQANIDLAGAIVSAALTKPFVPVGLAAMIAAGAAGLVQIAKIKSEKFAGGGFTPDVFGVTDETGHTPVGVVHNGEWVGNRAFVNDNKAFFNYLETIQSKKYRPFANGGFGSSGPVLPIPQVYTQYNTDGGRMFTKKELEDFGEIVANKTAKGVYNAIIDSSKEKERINLRRETAVINNVR